MQFYDVQLLDFQFVDNSVHIFDSRIKKSPI